MAWVPYEGSLHVVPSAAVHGANGPDDEANAWRQTVQAARRAGGKAAEAVAKRGMRAQFGCHWRYARIAEPRKPSWNLEPWRPVVSEQAMMESRCNPGGPEI